MTFTELGEQVVTSDQWLVNIGLNISIYYDEAVF